MSENEPFVPTEISEYSKSNFLIGAKYKSSLLENKILAISLAHSDSFDVDERNTDSPIYSRISVSELRKTLGANKGSFYQQLNQVASQMTGKSIGMSTEDSKAFDYIAVVTRARCENGIFTIEYNHALRKYIYQIKKNYSRLNLNLMLRFKNNYSFRLYELLHSKCYRMKDDPSAGNFYNIRFSLAELKLELGIVNAELDSVKRVLRNQKNPDYDRAVEVSPEQMFESWSDFRRKVLEKAVKEINDSSDMHIEYETIKKGKGGKVCLIDFKVVMDEKTETSGQNVEPIIPQVLSEDEKLDIIVDIKALLGRDFTAKDARKIADAAEYDYLKVEEAVDAYRKSRGVQNPVGWIIAAIREGYSISEAGDVKDPFLNFEERDYDFEDLEARFAKN
ncbi:Initiator Replication protein [Lachnospiraceae bacterium]|nr:Initiator Replication protein [Lachnospiraceae bacterium]